MSRAETIAKILAALNMLPENMCVEVAAFVEHITEEQQLQAGIQSMIANSDAFSFLKDEEDLYTMEDIKP